MSEKKLIIGTANFGILYRGVLVPQSEQDKIWDYCRQVGIDTVDTATAYGDIKIPEDFKVINKFIWKTDSGWFSARQMFNIRHARRDALKPVYYCGMIHHAEDIELLKCQMILAKNVWGFFDKVGLSIYTPADLLGHELTCVDIVQLPINTHQDGGDGSLWDSGPTDWLKELKKRNIEIHARSIFGGGDLAKCYGVKFCLEYVLKKPIDKIVVGVETLGQLKEIVEVFNGL